MPSRATRNLTRGLAVFGAGAFTLHAWRLVLSLGGAPTRYHVDRERLPPIDSAEFRNYLSAIVDAQIHGDAAVSVLRNGEEFYRAELAAIEAAQHAVHLEAYEFLEGDVTREFVRALTDRARQGVEVRLVLDAIGSMATRSSFFAPLRAAGGRVVSYHPVDARSWPYLNHRTHRKLLLTGDCGFIGGAGFADQWLHPNRQGPRWRDTMFRVEGGTVASLNAVFAENWLEATGEILAGNRQFPEARTQAGILAMVVSSTPHGGTTRARILYQALMEAANRSIQITTPYFVPDRSARKTLERAAQRGVAVKILTVGPHSDHPMTRRLSHRFSSALDRAGAEIFEYQPGMIHAKLMTVDGLWTVAGSTNFDHRSFELNDEVNLVLSNREVASRIHQDFEKDLRDSRRLTLRRLRDSGTVQEMEAAVSWLARREQ